MRKLNETSCNALYAAVEWWKPEIIITLIILAIINVMVVLGNFLVIAAVYNSIKLRNVTNMFIVSLAVADLMVGVTVLPFSATWEVYKVWIFGDIWCSIWLAVDVWMCTASILNLCAISLDRYLAVTRPIKYPQIMSPNRARLLVAIVWVLSFIICFPPLVGWKDERDDDVKDNITLSEDESFNTTAIILAIKPCRWICELTNDAGYVVYSALGSFYIPTLIMLFFYWRIYNAAVSTTRAINRGFRTTKSSRMIGSRFDEQRLTLRIHRGRTNKYTGSNCTYRRDDGVNSRSPSKRERIKISISYPSTETLSTKCNNTLDETTLKYSQSSLYYSNGQIQSQLFTSSKTHLKGYSGEVSVRNEMRLSQRNSTNQENADVLSLREFTPGTNTEKPRVMKMGKRNIKAQVKRIRMETKAAKTLGIIVGGFILCWLPFFSMYVVRAFFPNYIHPTVFSILFWLGYCNSAINPCIYALFSKDFRFAFKKIICTCFCKHTNTARRGSDGSQLTRNERSPSHVQCRPSQGFSFEDSDPNPGYDINVQSHNDSR